MLRYNKLSKPWLRLSSESDKIPVQLGICETKYSMGWTDCPPESKCEILNCSNLSQYYMDERLPGHLIVAPLPLPSKLDRKVAEIQNTLKSWSRTANTQLINVMRKHEAPGTGFKGHTKNFQIIH